jgi:hypothetical protein
MDGAGTHFKETEALRGHRLKRRFLHLQEKGVHLLAGCPVDTHPGYGAVPALKEGIQILQAVEAPSFESIIFDAATACTSTPEALETDPDFTGFITEVHLIGEKDTPGQIMVESHADKLVDKYVVSIRDETQVYEQQGADLRQVAFSALGTTQQVQMACPPIRSPVLMLDWK